MRRVLVLLPINRIILSVRLWITDHIFHRQGNKKVVRTSVIVWVIAAGSLFAYPHLLTYLQQSQADYTQLSNYPEWIIPVVLWVYIVLILFINTFLTKRLTPWRRVIKNFLLLAWIVALSYFVLGKLSIEDIILYYLLVAFSEEALKYLWGLTLFEKRRFSSSDIILFAFLTALWFAFFENIIYVADVMSSQETRVRQIVGGTWLIIARGIIWFVVHLLFTGTIAYFSAKAISSQKSFLYLIPAFLIWLLLHLSYNVLVHRNISIAIIIYVIVWYALLSRLFYKADSIYLK